MLKNLYWRTTQVPQTRVYLKYILILLKFVFHNIVYNINLSSFSSSSLGSSYRLRTELYNHVRVNCSTSRHKTTAVVGGPWVGGWPVGTSLWHWGRRERSMDPEWGAEGEKCALTRRKEEEIRWKPLLLSVYFPMTLMYKKEEQLGWFFSFFLRSSFVHVHKLKCFFSLFFFFLILPKAKGFTNRMEIGDKNDLRHLFFYSLFSFCRTWGSG